VEGDDFCSPPCRSFIGSFAAALADPMQRLSAEALQQQPGASVAAACHAQGCRALHGSGAARRSARVACLAAAAPPRTCECGCCGWRCRPSPVLAVWRAGAPTAPPTAPRTKEAEAPHVQRQKGAGARGGGEVTMLADVQVRAAAGSPCLPQHASACASAAALPSQCACSACRCRLPPSSHNHTRAPAATPRKPQERDPIQLVHETEEAAAELLAAAARGGAAEQAQAVEGYHPRQRTLGSGGNSGGQTSAGEGELEVMQLLPVVVREPAPAAPAAQAGMPAAQAGMPAAPAAPASEAPAAPAVRAAEATAAPAEPAPGPVPGAAAAAAADAGPQRPPRSILKQPSATRREPPPQQWADPWDEDPAAANTGVWAAMAGQGLGCYLIRDLKGCGGASIARRSASASAVAAPPHQPIRPPHLPAAAPIGPPRQRRVSFGPNTEYTPEVASAGDGGAAAGQLHQPVLCFTVEGELLPTQGPTHIWLLLETA